MVRTANTNIRKFCNDIVSITILFANATGYSSEPAFDKAHANDIILRIFFIAVGYDLKLGGLFERYNRAIGHTNLSECICLRDNGVSDKYLTAATQWPRVSCCTLSRNLAGDSHNSTGNLLLSRIVCGRIERNG